MKKMTLREAREQGKLDQFAAEREAESATPGDEHAFNRAVEAMAGKSKPTPGTSKRDRSDD